MPIKISVLSLGCARNLVDSEVMLGILKKAGCEIVESTDNADVAIINTCSFIEDAKKESIDVILDAIDLKKKGKIKKILVAGCLPQKYGRQLKKELAEIDGFVGVDSFAKLPKIIKALVNKKEIFDIVAAPRFLYNETTPRLRLTPKHYAYVKVSEGCSHKCSFCIIPKLRGPHRSRAIESVVREVEALIKNGVKELNIIGQDTTLYGMDLYGRPTLSLLLKKLARLKNIGWLRLLYTHPAHFTDELIAVIKNEPVICKYIDLPLQHINDRILKAMNRGTTKRLILKLLDKIRKNIPNVAIRTSLIVGFPGETKAEFSELLNFVKDARFERLGVFTYSKEEGTSAFGFSKQVCEKEKQKRRDRIMKLQQKISKENSKKLLNKELDVIIDEQDPSDSNLYLSRGYMDAPEVDGIVHINMNSRKPLTANRTPLKLGQFVRIKVMDTYEYDLVGDVI